MFTDIVGFTPLTQDDERGALRVLQEQEELVSPLLAAHQGRKIKSIGDGLLIEFEDALDAVECGVELQLRLRARNRGEGVRSFRIRVGIHLGDVQRQGDDILGDAVNIASRIVPLAEPGGVCISEHVAAQVRNKVAYRLEDLGRRSLKGVREPVTLYRVLLPGTGPETLSPSAGVPRLAVLPFANISPDPKDEYFADGLTEELITTLSQLHNLQVIARTSVMQYRAAPKSIAQVGAELGVSAVLEGSVRKADRQLRITVQLIDVASQAHTWASTYDRTLDDIFAIQTEVAKRIAEALKVRLAATEERRLEKAPRVDPDSYLAYLRGRNVLRSSYREEVMASAAKEFQTAIALDPRNAMAYSALADVTNLSGAFYRRESRASWTADSRPLAEKALELDPNLAEAHASLGLILYNNAEWTAAEKEFEIALDLSPSYSAARVYYGALLMEEGRPDQALRELALAEASDPLWASCVDFHTRFLVTVRRMVEAKTSLDHLRTLDPAGLLYYGALAYYHLANGDLAQALPAVGRAEGQRPGSEWFWRLAYLCQSGAVAEARTLLAEVEARPAPEPISTLAQGHALLGDLDGCFRLLEQGAREGVLSLQYLRNDPWFESVRADPRFGRILKELNLP